MAIRSISSDVCRRILHLPGAEIEVTASTDTSGRKRTASDRCVTPTDYEALDAFQLALRRFLALSESSAMELGLTSQQHQALLAVRAHPGPGEMTIGELANALMVKNHSALGLVDRLVERGLLERRASPHDRRRVMLKLSDLGQRKLESISRNNLGQLKTTLPEFTDLLRALEQLDFPDLGAKSAGT